MVVPGVLLALAITALFGQSGPASAAPPAAYTVLVDRMPQRGGVILLAPTDIRNNPAVPRAADPDALAPAEVQVRAWNGKLLARRVMPTGQEAGNFAIQTYRGQRVYTWWQGASLPGHGAGSYIIADKNFRVLRRLHTPAGTSGDLHEFRILPDGHRAAVTSYVHTTSVVRGVRVPVIDSRFYILDIDTDAAQFGWSSLRHVPVDATTTPLPIPGEGLDYFHINSVFPDGAGNYLISSRNTSALYLIDGRTGNVRATIGGVHSSLRVPDAARFANQHDAELRPDGTIRLFDNNASVPVLGGPSSILTLRPDWQHGTVRVVSRVTSPDRLTAWAMGNAQTLADGSVFGGWGTTGHISAFSAHGTLIYDAKLSGMLTTYRAFYYSTGL